MMDILARLLSGLILASCILISVSASEDEEREGGILGTGIHRAGMMGVVTKLGSIYVNGQHVRFDDDMKLTSVLGERTAASLVPGESVVVEAERKDNAWRALRIQHYVPLLGTLKIESDGGYSVLGSTVEVQPETELVRFDEAMKDGDWIVVNGLWRGSSVVSTLIERIEPQSRVTITGSYLRKGANGSIEIGDTKVSGIPVRNAQLGDVLQVTGRFGSDAVAAITVKKGLFDAKTGLVLMEGYLSEPNETGLYTLHGSGIISYADGTGEPMSSARGLYCAPSSSGQEIIRIRDLPEDFTKRKELLESGKIDLDQACR